MNAPRLIAGGIHADPRGKMRFCNAFDLSPVRRFYTIACSRECSKRGWILHRHETKWFFPLKGMTTVQVAPDGDESVRETFVLDAAIAPHVLCVPPGNWFLIEQEEAAEVQVFSDCRLGQFKDDDFRKEELDGKA